MTRHVHPGTGRVFYRVRRPDWDAIALAVAARICITVVGAVVGSLHLNGYL